jgi:hypothetical protein
MTDIADNNEKLVRVIVEDWAGNDKRPNRPIRVGVDRWTVVLWVNGEKFHRTMVKEAGPKFLLNKDEAKALAKSLARTLGVKPEYPIKPKPKETL